MDSTIFLNSINRSDFSISPYSKTVPKPWGKEIHLAPADGPYMMKVIEISDGCRLSLQAHDRKTESWTLLSGEAAVLLEDTDGELHELPLKIGEGYSCAIGQRHRLVGKKDARVFEASTPEIGITFRLEDDFARPDETEELRKLDRSEA